MRKIVAAVVISSLSVLTINANAASTVKFTNQKAGQFCKTADKNKSVTLPTATILKCIPSGGKYRWMVDQAALPTPTLTATPSKPLAGKPLATPTPVVTYLPVSSTLKTVKIESDLEITYYDPINWGGLPATSNAEMKFPVLLKSNVDAAIIRVLVQHAEGVQHIMVSGKWDWQYVKAGTEKVMELTVPLSTLKGERDKGYTGGYFLNVNLAYADTTKREAMIHVPIGFVLPTTS